MSVSIWNRMAFAAAPTGITADLDIARRQAAGVMYAAATTATVW